MAALTMFLFLDGREKERSISQLNKLVRALPRGHEQSGRITTIGLSTAFNPHQWSAAYPTAYEGRFHGVSVDSLLKCVRDTDWEYPVPVIYRATSDTKWSFVTMGISTPERLRD